MCDINIKLELDLSQIKEVSNYANKHVHGAVAKKLSALARGELHITFFGVKFNENRGAVEPSKQLFFYELVFKLRIPPIFRMHSYKSLQTTVAQTHTIQSPFHTFPIISDSYSAQLPFIARHRCSL